MGYTTHHATPVTDKPIDVMLVDDHQCVLWGLERLVNGESPRMRVAGMAGNGQEACRLAREIDPDVIVLDLDLDGRNGTEFVPDLSANARTRVLILTGSRDEAARREAMMRGARGVVTKDQPGDTLLRAIERVHAGEIWLDRSSVGDLLAAMTAPPPPPRVEDTRIATLTERERQIIRELVRHREANGKVVAGRLCISEHTLRNHLTTIFGKLAVRNRLALVLFAIENKLDE